jgi:hypothetical protein
MLTGPPPKFHGTRDILSKFSEFFGFLWPAQYRAFPEAEASKAREWITEAQR